MRKRFMVLILVLGVLFAPAIAFADDGFEGSGGGDFSDKVIYGPNVLNIQSGTYGVQVYAGNKFNAALCVLGFDGNDSRFTNDVKAYLSNESTGGSFYEFSNLFTNNNSPNIGGFDAYNITFTSAIGTNNTLYGAEFVWIARYTDTLRQSAYARVQDVLDGNTGGGSGGNDGGYEGNYQAPDTLTFTMSNFVSADDTKMYSEFYKDPRPNPYLFTLDADFTVTLNDTLKNNLNSTGETFSYATFILWRNSYIYYNSSVNVDCYLSKNSPVVNGTDNLVITGGYYHIQFETTQVTNNGHNDLTITRVYSPDNLPNYSGDTTFSLRYKAAYVIGAGIGAPVVPPTQWPEPDPVTPTEPPEVPTPTPTDPPTEPTITVPTSPTLPPLTYPTEPTYQTPDIAAILDAMAKHCVHLQECMKNVSDDYYDSMTAYMLTLQNKDFEFLRSWFRVTLDTIRDCFDDLSDYLQRLFTWLADQMDFTFTGGDYDDSSIVWWLKRIYSKLGSGTTVKPTDPVVDPKGIGDWFDQLLKNFVLDLLALGQDALADVAEMFRQLITKFPFSIPWDIAAMLALFAATPQIPVIQIPQYALTGNGISQVGMYTIDLTPYDGAMGIARSVENVVFAFWLAWKIDFFKAILTGVLGGDK